MTANKCHLSISKERKQIFTGVCPIPVRIGRQRREDPEPLPVRLLSDSQPARLLIAPHMEEGIGRDHLEVKSLHNSKMEIVNHSRLGTETESGLILQKNETEILPVSTLLILGKYTIRLQSSPSTVGSLESRPFIPRESHTAIPFHPEVESLLSQTLYPVDLLKLRSVLVVIQLAATSQDFFERAVQQARKTLGFHSARLLLRKGDKWIEAAQDSSYPNSAPNSEAVSDTVLDNLLAQGLTFWQLNNIDAENVASLQGVADVIAAPILSNQDEVIGALYCSRLQELTEPNPITEIEAVLVEMVAGAVAAGLERIKVEDEATKNRALFGQFFSPTLARRLESNPKLLEGQDADVTVIVCDIRGFSRTSYQIGPKDTVRWIRTVLTDLSEAVTSNDGVLVDYVGDELMGFWGAPEAQPNHAQLALRAAMTMIKGLEQLNERLKVVGLPCNTNFGIGLHSGAAHVGNVGSDQKFKYGPLGNTVNVASRVQGLTKYLKARALLTGEVFERLEQLGVDAPIRRLTRVRVKGILEPVAIYELLDDAEPNWQQQRDEYESALHEFEIQDFRSAARRLGNLRMTIQDDGPALVLLSRAVQCMVEEPKDFTPVWDAPGK